MEKILKLFLLAILACVFTLPVNAQSFSLQITPKTYELISQRNKTIKLPYTITNIGDPQLITVSIYTLQIKDNKGNYDIQPFIQSEKTISFKIDGNTIALDQPFLMKSKNTLDFDLEITIPESTTEMDYTFTVVAESQPQKGFGNSDSISIQGGVGSNIILSVTDSGGLDQKGKIIQFEILSKNSFTFNGQKIFYFNSNTPIPLILTAANSGKNASKASGSITLISSNKEKKTEQPSFTIPAQYLLAGSQRILKTTNDPVCDENKIEACKETHSAIIKSPFIGFYTLAAVVSFGENSQIGYENITFISFPFLYASIVLPLLIVIILVLLRLRKKYK